jgi:cation transporter-like permease
MEREKTRVLLRNLAIELVVYAILVIIYSFIVLRLLNAPLTRLFHTNLVTYAFVALGLIVAQGALLDVVTSFLLERLRLDR